MQMPEKIRALLAQAGNTPYEEEAAVFFAKAQELMEKYAIDEETLWAGTRNKTEKPIVEAMVFKGDNARDKLRLLCQVAKCNRCKAWRTHNTQGTRETQARIAGYPSDIAFVQIMFTSLLLQMNAAMGPAMMTTTSDINRNWKINYVDGYISKLNVRLQDAQKVRSTGTSTDIVLAREQRVKDYIRDDLGLRFSSMAPLQRNKNYSAYSAGMSAAERADLNANARLRQTPQLGG